MNIEFLSALDRIEREKGISKEILLEAIESALASAARKVIDDPGVSKEDIAVNINNETGEIEVYSDGEQVNNELFGRIAAQTAKQVIMQKIREAERDVVFNKYEKKIGTILSGAVHRFEKGNVIVELDDAEAILSKHDQIPREKFRQGEVIRAFLKDVERGTSGPAIVLSRTDPGFVRKLFELEVPEISQGVVEIRSLARESGERTKIAVYSKDEKIDPVGACVGMRGSRVRDIVKELHGERIDVIKWSDDIREYLPAAVSPAQISKMVIDRKSNKITLTVMQDQLSLLIGKKGRNIRLASKLLGWELEAEAIREIPDIPLTDVKGISKKAMENLEAAEYDNIEKVISSGVKGLTEVEGIGAKTAEKIVNACEETLKVVETEKSKDEEKTKNIEKDTKEGIDPFKAQVETEVKEEIDPFKAQAEVDEKAEEPKEEVDPFKAQDEVEEKDTKEGIDPFKAQVENEKKEEEKIANEENSEEKHEEAQEEELSEESEDEQGDDKEA